MAFARIGDNWRIVPATKLKTALGAVSVAALVSALVDTVAALGAALAAFVTGVLRAAFVDTVAAFVAVLAWAFISDILHYGIAEIGGRL